MKERSFADFLIGALACMSLLAVYTLVNATQTDAPRAAEPERSHRDERSARPRCARVAFAHFWSGRPCASVYLPVTIMMMSMSCHTPQPPSVQSWMTPKRMCPE